MKYIAILMLIISTNVYSQEEVKSINFIIVIDEEIVTNPIDIKLVINSKKEGNYKVIEPTIGYYPGNISLRKHDYDDLVSNDTQSVILKLNYLTYRKNRPYYYKYEFDVGKIWFKQTFTILKIYNLDKKKYRKNLIPLSKEKNYTFDLQTAQGQMIRIRAGK